jgi:YVTN family beta-propeller protein
VWVANHGESTVSRIDLAVNRVVATIQVGSGLGRLMAFDGAVWVTDDRDQLVWRIDPSTNRARSIDVGGRVSGAPAAGRGSIWVTVWHDARLVRIEPATGRVVARMRTLVQPLGVQFADGSLWIANSINGAGMVARVDPESQRILARFTLGRFPWFQSADEGDDGLWVADGVAGAAGEAWVNLSTSLSRIDAGTNEVAESMPIGGSPGGLAVGLGAVWVAGFNADTVWRIEPG